MLMKITFFLFLNLVCCTLMAQITDKELVGVYHFTQHTVPGTDEPSTCDCDYKQEILNLNKNATFEYIQQKGRISPKQNIYYGTWTVEDETIILKSNQQGIAISDIPYKTTKGKKEKSSKIHYFEIKSTFKIRQRYSDNCLKR